MKKAIFAALALIILAGCPATKSLEPDAEITEPTPPPPPPPMHQECPSNPDHPHDFRQADWGMDRSQVLASETAIFESETDETVQFKGTHAGHQAAIIYHFGERGLDYSVIFPTDRFETWEQYIKSYTYYKDTAVKRYGRPIDSTASFRDYELKGDVVRGPSEFNTHWTFCNTLVYVSFDEKVGIAIGHVRMDDDK